MRHRLSVGSRHLLRALCVATLVTLALPAAAQTRSSWCAGGKPVKFAGLTWESGTFITALMRQVMERGYGCATEEIIGNSITLETALSTNDIQVFAEEWTGRSDAWNHAAAAGKVKAVGKVIQGAAEGWYVPDFVVNGDAARGIKPLAPALNAVSDLPLYKNVFKDEEEPDKGRFLNCPSGWTCEGINSRKLEAYKLAASYVNFRPGTGAALDAAVLSAVQRGKPILFYYWTPTGLMGRYKFIRLREPAYNAACYKTLTDRNGPAPCGSSDPEPVIQAGLSRAFHDGDPALVAMLGKFQVPIQLLNQALGAMADKKLGATAAAKEFLKANPALWHQWVPDDVAARIARSLT